MKKKLGVMLSTSVFTFSGFGMELQEDASSTKSSTVVVQSAMTVGMENKDAEQMVKLQKLLEAQVQVEVDFVNSTIKYCKPCFPVSEISFSSIIDIGTKHTKLFEEEAINLTLTE